VSGPDVFRVPLPERGVELAVVDFGGPGSAALCAHANGFCARLWEPVAHELRRELRIVAYDARGHGDSSSPAPGPAYEWEELARDAIALADALRARLGIARFELGVGNSMGGATTLAASARRADLFGRTVSIDPVVLPARVDRSRIPADNPMAQAARKRRPVFAAREAVIKAYRERRTFADWQPRALELYAEHGFRQRSDGQVELKCSGEIEAELFSRAPSLDLRAELRSLRVPGVLLHASRGDFSIEGYRELAAQCSALRVESLESGHLAPMIDPELVAERLRAELATSRRPAPTPDRS
jgi:pimeloyl-ACP methyl ester carboxylesterase